MQQMKKFAILLVTVGITLTIGLKITSDIGAAMNLENSITDEVHTPSDALPSNFTVDEASKTNFEKIQDGTVAVTWYDASANANKSLSSGNFSVYNSVGKVEMQNTAYFDAYNTSEGDKLYTDYDAILTDTTAKKGADDAIKGLTELSGFLPIIGLVIAAAIVITLVSSGYSSSGRRGRA